MATRDADRFPHFRVEGGPDPASLKIFRDGKELHSVVEFQFHGSTTDPVTAIFKEIVVFDGSVDIMPTRKTPLETN